MLLRGETPAGFTIRNFEDAGIDPYTFLNIR